LISISEHIKYNIEQTSKRFSTYRVKTAEDMIPLMNVTKYDNRLLDVQYGTKTKYEKMDIFYPDDKFNKPYPVFIEVHGGAWYFGQKRSIEFEPFLYGLSQGYVCISLGYTLAPDGHYPLPVQEIKSAIRFIRYNSNKYSIDPNRVVLWGGSAGAQLAALAALSCDTKYLEEDLFGNDQYSAKPNVMILWYGCYDYFSDRKLEEWIYRNYMGVDDLTTVYDKLEKSNPITHITSNAIPVLLQHGLADSVVPYNQSVKFYEKMKKIVPEDQCKISLFPNCDHADKLFFEKENIKNVFAFSDNYLNQI
jgi:acetyl esterase/lipase